MTTELDFFINSLHDEGIDTIKVLNDLNDFFDGDEIPIVFLLGSFRRERFIIRNFLLNPSVTFFC